MLYFLLPLLLTSVLGGMTQSPSNCLNAGGHTDCTVTCDGYAACNSRIMQLKPSNTGRLKIICQNGYTSCNSLTLRSTTNNGDYYLCCTSGHLSCNSVFMEPASGHTHWYHCQNNNACNSVDPTTRGRPTNSGCSMNFPPPCKWDNQCAPPADCTYTNPTFDSNQCQTSCGSLSCTTTTKTPTTTTTTTTEAPTTTTTTPDSCSCSELIVPNSNQNGIRGGVIEDTATVICNPGFAPSWTEAVARCTANDKEEEVAETFGAVSASVSCTWIAPTCDPVSCGPLNVPFSDVSAGVGKTGTVLPVKCDDGYFGSGDATCEAVGLGESVWSSVTCAPSFCEPLVVANSDQSEGMLTGIEVGEDADVVCDDGFSGSGLAYCVADKGVPTSSWVKPTCVSMSGETDTTTETPPLGEVTCTFTVDALVTDVFVNGQQVDFGEEGLAPKAFSFKEARNGGATLALAGAEASSCKATDCQGSEKLLSCTSSDPSSPWNDVVCCAPLNSDVDLAASLDNAASVLAPRLALLVIATLLALF